MNLQKCECGKRINYRADRKTFDQCYECRRKPGGQIPCDNCGQERRRRDVEAGQRCRNCARIEREEQQALKEAARVDWAAVEWVIQGYSKVLNSAERRLVVRRMSSRLWTDTGSRNIPPGFVLAEDLSARMGCALTATSAIRKRLPKATQRRCPECRGDMWVIDATGLVEEHGSGYLERCPMSDQPADALAVSA